MTSTYRFTAALGLLALVAVPPVARTQARWTDIGRTPSGNMVSVEPRSVKRTAQASLHVYDGSGVRAEDEPMMAENADDVAAVIAELEVEMQEAAGRLEFERAALLRDQVNALKSGDYRKVAKTAAKDYPTGRSGSGAAGRGKAKRR